MSGLVGVIGRIFLLAVILSLFPVLLQVIFYNTGKLFFRKASKPKVFTVSTAINALICGGISYWLCFAEEYDEPLAPLTGIVFAAACGITILIMVIYNIRQYSSGSEDIPAKNEQIGN